MGRSEMTRIGIIGTGWGARVQVPAFREVGLQVVAVAGHRAEKTRRLAGELGGLQAYDDWRGLIGSDVDLVSIVTPPSEHREMATAALEAGKHVLSEKPTALDAAEAEALVETAGRYPGQLALIDHELRFLPAWLDARRRIRELGPLRYIEVRYASPGRGDRSRAWNWWSDAASGGGIWGAVGSHFVDAIRYFGFEIEAAQAALQTTIAKRPFEDATRRVTSDDVASVNLRLRGGALASMQFSAVSAGPDEPAVLTFNCEQGALRLVGEEALLSTNGRPFTRFAGSDLESRPGNSPGGAFGSGTIHLGHALHAYLDEGQDDALERAATFTDGLAQQRVLDAARRSAAREGRWETVS